MRKSRRVEDTKKGEKEKVLTFMDVDGHVWDVRSIVVVGIGV